MSDKETFKGLGFSEKSEKIINYIKWGTIILTCTAFAIVIAKHLIEALIG